jgi:UDP-GlcNAc:undecaprenyl-phosphate GlcNAc-1-phosphate transferase
VQFLIFAAALLISAILTRCVRDFALARGWAKGSNSEHHLHTRPTPRLGGVAIFLTLWAMLPLTYWFSARSIGAESLLHFSVKILAPATVIFLLGLVDDFYGLNAYVKFTVQSGAAVILFCNGFGVSRFSIMDGMRGLGWLLGVPLTILWVLWITNAFNLIDGLDGLAAGSALFSTLVTCVVAMLFHSQGTMFLSLALAGAIAGFLRYNFNPASIFLGDCGSLLIGFLLSAIALAGSQKSPTLIAVAIPVVSLGLPILDVTVAVIRRFLSRQKLFDADREHIHHKLLGRGISHRQAVLVLYGVSACFGLLSLSLLHPSITAVTAVLVVVSVGILIGIKELRYHEFLELGRVLNRTLNQRQVIANDIRVRRAVDSLDSVSDPLQFCRTLQKYLQPLGFDGCGLHLSSELPSGAEVSSFTCSNRSKLNFFWNSSISSSETNWSLSFRLDRRNGEFLGGFTLYRRKPGRPLLMDLDIFTATGFSRTVAAAVERMQDVWFPKQSPETTTIPGYGAVRASVAARRAPSLAARASR